MKNSPYTPDEFMASLYGKLCADPYKNAESPEEVRAVSETIKKRAEDIFNLSALKDNTPPVMTKAGDCLNYEDYTLQKYSLDTCENLKTAVFVLTPKSIKENAPAVVALCGHGYGVRQILNISKSGKKKHIRYLDNYQKNFAVELVKKGCIVIAPELFGFGEARLKRTLSSRFISAPVMNCRITCCPTD